VLAPGADLETLAKRTITLYNRTHSPNTRVTLVKYAYPLLVVEFTGIFCTGCSTQNITDAFEYQFKTLGHRKATLKTTKNTQVNPRGFQIVYLIKEAS
jgi:hypothetical protein